MDSGRRGRFTRLAVCVDLKKPLVLKVKINGSKNKASNSGVNGEESMVENMETVRDDGSDNGLGGSQFLVFAADSGVNDPVIRAMDGGISLVESKDVI
ncbi:hypothetical protein Gorai_017615 [Gossypium raimondii]|uniref:Uncharacterized protein n=1 Tax=Gossypium raimondii TaxID=29730 RepID=A0A7J8PCG3_GOSRA|nr:hypothetical protein [Gossypium raimondii]